MQPSLYGTNGTVDCFADLLVALPLLVEQDEHFAIFIPERINRRADGRSQFTRIVGRAMVGGLMKVIRELWSLAAASHPCATTIDGDAEQPGPERTAGIPTTQAAKNAQEDFLSHILGVVSMGQQTVAETEYVHVESLDQLAAGGWITGQAAADARRRRSRRPLMRDIPGQGQAGFSRSSIRKVVRTQISGILGK